jgi:hypothetical protein
MALIITNNLVLSGNATFTSNAFVGFTTLNYSQPLAGSIVTLKAGVTYTINGQLTIGGTGGFNGRCTLQSDTKFTATGGIASSNVLTFPVTLVPALGSKPAGSQYLVSQSPTNGPIQRKGILGLNDNDTTQITSFPAITGGANPTYTLSKPASVSTRIMQVGLTAKFIHNGDNTLRNITFVTTFDIDSEGSNGIIKASNSYQNRVGIPNPNLWRTVNWDSLVPLAPLITAAYVE